MRPARVHRNAEGRLMKYLVQAILSLAVVLLCTSQVLASAKLTSLCEVHFPSDARMEWNCVKLTWEDTPENLFGAYWQDVLRFNRMDRRHFYGGISIKVPVRLEDIKGFTPLPTFYPDAAAEEKFILVDQSEMFLGAYEHGKLVLSFPAAVGIEGHRVPNGEFRVDAVDRRHTSNMYPVEEIGRPYPMHYGLRFFMDKSLPTTPSYYIHGRDVPGIRLPMAVSASTTRRCRLNTTAITTGRFTVRITTNWGDHCCRGPKGSISG